MHQSILASVLLLVQTISIYTISFQEAGGSQKSFSAYQGKKILIVNIATGSSRVSQLLELQQLQNAHDSTLVVIAFPSNSFSHEARSNAEIKSFCQSTYNTTFVIAEKGAVNGANRQAVYQWLTDQTQNGDLNVQVGGDFQKFLIGKTGKIEGVFAGSVSPLSQQIQNAINTQ